MIQRIVLLLFLVYMSNAYSLTWKIYKDHFRLPYIITLLDGQQHFFQIDTGSVTGLHLNEETFSQLQKKCNNKSELKTVDLTGKKSFNSQCIADALVINNAIFHNVSIARLNSWGLTSTGERPDTEVMGIDLFKKGTVIIDDINGYIHYAAYDAEKVNLSNEKYYKFILNKNGMVIRDEVQQLSLIVDTGSTVSMIWKKTAAVKEKNCTAVFPVSVFPKTKDEDCSTVDFYLTNSAGEIKKFSAMYMKNTGNYPEDTDGLIGGNFLSDKKVTIDFVRGIMYTEDE